MTPEPCPETPPEWQRPRLVPLDVAIEAGSEMPVTSNQFGNEAS